MAVVQCPNCGTPVVWNAASTFRPFCSMRCKNADLGAWASERYAIGDGEDTDGDAPDFDESK